MPVPGGMRAAARAARVVSVAGVVSVGLALSSNAAHADVATPEPSAAVFGSAVPALPTTAASPSATATTAPAAAPAPSATPAATTQASPAVSAAPTPAATTTPSPAPAPGATAGSTPSASPAPVVTATPAPALPPTLTSAPDADEPPPVVKTPPLTPAQIKAGRDLAAAQRRLSTVTARAAAALQVHAQAVLAAEAASLDARVERKKLAAAHAATAAARDALGAYAAEAYRNGPTGRSSLAGIASLLEAEDPAQLLQRSVDIGTVGRGRVLAIDALRRTEYQEDLVGRSVAAAASGAAWAARAADKAKTEADAAVAAAAAVVATRLVAVGGTVDVSMLGTMGPVPAGACQGGPTLGFPDGQIPLALLCPLWGAPGHLLRADAAAHFNAMSQAYAATFGRPICVTDSYRDLPTQVSLYAHKPTLAAVPGTSNHGWARAVDLCDGAESFGTVTHQWLVDNAPSFGWFDPAWARVDGSKPEPWHWEFGG